MIRFFKTPFVFRYLFRRREWGFSDQSSVYLTFDDGPTLELTQWILDFLSKEDIKATFFCVGENAQKHRDLMNRTTLEGHSVGNHTMDHLKGISGSKDDYLDSIEKASAVIDSNLFRPPYGRMSLRQGGSICKKYRVIMWSWLSYDYDPKIPVNKILKRAKNQIQGGDIIVLHDNLKVESRLKEILPELVNIIREKNLSFKAIKQESIS